jgi:hypothetical protein
MKIQRAGRGTAVDSGPGLLTGVSKFIQTAPLPTNDPCLIFTYCNIVTLTALRLAVMGLPGILMKTC